MPDDDVTVPPEEFERRRRERDKEKLEKERLRAKREDLRLGHWLKRELPERDYLLGSVLSSTSRWMIFGDTGLGKTLFAMSLAGAVASGQGLLNWGSRSPRRVMYLDGEMPAETFKERMQLLAAMFGDELDLWGYNRDILALSDMPPLNSEAGQNWLWWEIAALQPEAIFFDSLMCLTSGLLSDEESWLPMKLMVERLSAWRIAQVWLHHTGHDATHAFGTKTREWLMDTVLGLFKADEQDARDTVMKLEFTKTRLRTPQTAHELKPQVIRLVDGHWTSGTPEATPRHQSQDEIMRNAIFASYDHLADGVTPSLGLNGARVLKVKSTAVSAEIKRRGFLGTDEAGRVTGAARESLRRAKNTLLASHKLIERDGFLWRP